MEGREIIASPQSNDPSLPFKRPSRGETREIETKGKQDRLGRGRLFLFARMRVMRGEIVKIGRSPIVGDGELLLFAKMGDKDKDGRQGFWVKDRIGGGGLWLFS